MSACFAVSIKQLLTYRSDVVQTVRQLTSGSSVRQFCHFTRLSVRLKKMDTLG